MENRADSIRYIFHALYEEWYRLGEVNPQFSYFERLARGAIKDSELRSRIKTHIEQHGGFKGL